jgi:hypothetical protein
LAAFFISRTVFDGFYPFFEISRRRILVMRLISGLLYCIGIIALLMLLLALVSISAVLPMRALQLRPNSNH